MSSVRSTTTGIWIPVYKCDPLYIIANMMIIFVSPHNQVLLGLLEPQVPHRLSTLPTYINVCEVLF